MQDRHNPYAIMTEGSRLKTEIIKLYHGGVRKLAVTCTEHFGEKFTPSRVYGWINGKVRVSHENYEYFLQILSAFGDGTVNNWLILGWLSTHCGFQVDPCEKQLLDEAKEATNPHGTKVFKDWDLKTLVHFLAGEVKLSFEDQVVFARVVGLSPDDVFPENPVPPKLPEPREKVAA